MALLRGHVRPTAWVRSVTRRLASHLDPRTPIVYRRSAVAGSLAGALEPHDRESIREVADYCGYTMTESRPKYTCAGVTLALLDVWVESRDGEPPLLREDLALPGWVTYAVFAALTGAFVWIYLPEPIGTSVFVGACLVFGGFLTGFLAIPSPIARYLDLVAADEPIDARSETERLRTVITNSYQTSCIGPPVTALLGGFAATGPVFLTGLPIIAREIRRSPYVDFSMIDTWLVFPVAGAAWLLGFWMLGLVVGAFIYSFENETTRIEIFPFDVLSRGPTPVPELSGGYLSLLGLAIVPLVAATESSFLLPAAYRLSSMRLWVYFLFPAMIVASTLPVFLYWWVVQNREYVYARTLDRLYDLGSRRRRLGIAALTIGVSATMVWALNRFLGKFWSYLVGPVLNRNPLPIVEKPFLVALLVVTLLPAAYILLGVVVQAVTHLAGLTWAVVRSVPVGETPHIGVPVRLTPTAEPQAAAVAIGPWQSVVVSRGLYDQLDDREAFAALLAHEEAHLQSNGIRPSDAQLSTLLPVIAAATVTGKNVFFALADFRSRELAADNHAARVVGSEPLARALEQVADEPGSRGFGAPFYPFAGAYTPGTLARPGSITSAAERYFGLLFGNFALVRAHPTVSERVNRLRSQE